MDKFVIAKARQKGRTFDTAMAVLIPNSKLQGYREEIDAYMGECYYDLLGDRIERAAYAIKTDRAIAVAMEEICRQMAALPTFKARDGGPITIVDLPDKTKYLLDEIVARRKAIMASFGLTERDGYA